MKPLQPMTVVSRLCMTLPRGVQHQTQLSPPALSTLLARTQGAGLEERLKQHSTYIPNHNKSSDLDLLVLCYTHQKLRFLRGKQVFWNMIYFSRRM